MCVEMDLEQFLALRCYSLQREKTQRPHKRLNESGQAMIKNLRRHRYPAMKSHKRREDPTGISEDKQRLNRPEGTFPGG